MRGNRILSRDSLGNEENRTLRKRNGFGMKDLLMLPKNSVGGEAETIPMIDKENFLHFNIVKIDTAFN
jgi:hypothetical protein